ncbi:hypothetical protein L6164_019443 [Bauhinia variegata]|uniref:Uncharacterized protein n=1 Tax=Bauhinia variegata TaxID=167791 RepID=A0ACB9MTR4_BAUVA|nr:hypothetical protein L6164_019443 [Bauhinia variegata]
MCFCNQFSHCAHTTVVASGSSLCDSFHLSVLLGSDLDLRSHHSHLCLVVGSTTVLRFSGRVLKAINTR